MDYTVSLDWRPGTQEGTSQAEGKQAVSISAPVELGGNDACWSPEHLLVASLQSCLMLTLLYFVKQQSIGLTAYSSNTTGTMAKTPEGLRFKSVTVVVKATTETGDDKPKLQKAMQLAKKFCPVSAALETPVDVTLDIATG